MTPEQIPAAYGGGFNTHEKRGAAFSQPTKNVGEGDRQGTPLWLYNLLRKEFRFDGDMFADHGNALSPRYWTLESPIVPSAFNGVGLTLFANPPYSRGNIRAAAETVRDVANWGNTVVGLTRLEPTAKWWSILRPICSEVRLLDTRLTFRGQSQVYNFPCMVWVACPPYLRRNEPHVWFWDTVKSAHES